MVQVDAFELVTASPEPPQRSYDSQARIVENATDTTEDSSNENLHTEDFKGDEASETG